MRGIRDVRFTPEADMLIVGINVWYVPKADIRSLMAGLLFGKIAKCLWEILLNARSGHARAALSSDRIVGSVDGGDIFSRDVHKFRRNATRNHLVWVIARENKTSRVVPI